MQCIGSPLRLLLMLSELPRVALCLLRLPPQAEAPPRLQASCVSDASRVLAGSPVPGSPNTGSDNDSLSVPLTVLCLLPKTLA